MPTAADFIAAALQNSCTGCWDTPVFRSLSPKWRRSCGEAKRAARFCNFRKSRASDPCSGRNTGCLVVLLACYQLHAQLLARYPAYQVCDSSAQTHLKCPEQTLWLEHPEAWQGAACSRLLLHFSHKGLTPSSILQIALPQWLATAD